MELIRRLVEHNKIQHAYLFTGPPGSGKKKAAMYLAKALLCENKISGGCGSCVECRRIDGENHPSLVLIQPDGNTIKIQQIKELQKKFSYRGIAGQNQIYIIEEADKMTSEASNSILKFLEEPIGNTIAILLSENPEHIVSTIVSRCQWIRFRASSTKALEEMYINKGIDASFAKFLSQLWQDVDYVVRMVEDEKFATIQKIVVQLTKDLLSSKHQYLVLLETEWFSKKFPTKDTEYLVDYMLYWFRDLLFMEMGLEKRCIFSVEELQKFRHRFTMAMLQAWVSDIMKYQQKLRYNINWQLALEGMLLKMQEEVICTG